MDALKSIWNQMPVVRLLLPFMAGIGICIGVDNVIIVFVLLLLLSISALIYINLQKVTSRVYKLRYVGGVAIALTMLSLGYIVTWFTTDSLNPNHISKTNHGDATYVGIITEPPVVKDKTVNALIDLQSIRYDDSSRTVTGKVMASIIKDDRSQSLRYGDQLTFSGVVKEYDEPKNPDQFNYKLYQSLHHIYQRTYLHADGWQVISVGNGNKLLTKVYAVRTYFLSLILREVAGTNELAVATAIMLGYRDYVTDEVTQAYAGSGVLHVLSVSGLHVAVLYYVLNFLLGWMDKRRKLEIIKGILVIVIMLFYAGLTGLSPPVLRSVWMFSLIVIAKLLDRDVSMYNVLSVSCIVLLLWDPYYIADVGFQLSYIAVAGIVYLYPMIFGLIEDTTIASTKIDKLDAAVNWLSRWTWGLISVSIAAQIATFPISIFYFHTFPNFFLLSNLLVIPLSNFVLISGMAMFVVGWSHRLLSIAGWIFDHLLIALNKIVFTIDVLPYALSRSVMLTAFEMIFFYIAIAMVCWYLADRRAKVLIASLCFMLILCTAFSIRIISHEERHELTVYHISGKKAISIIERGTVYNDFDSALIHDEMLMRYNIRDHWCASGVRSEMPMDSMKGCYALAFGKIYANGGRRIIIIDNEINNPDSEKLKSEVVIVSAGYKGGISDITDHLDFSQLVFDTSLKPWQLKKWKAECDSLKVSYHDCRDKAFVMNW